MSRATTISGTVSSPLHGITPRGRFWCRFVLNKGNKAIKLKVMGEAYLKSRNLLIAGKSISVSGKMQTYFGRSDRKGMKIQKIRKLNHG